MNGNCSTGHSRDINQTGHWVEYHSRAAHMKPDPILIGVNDSCWYELRAGPNLFVRSMKGGNVTAGSV
jgi:hypothetical protein